MLPAALGGNTGISHVGLTYPLVLRDPPVTSRNPFSTSSLIESSTWLTTTLNDTAFSEPGAGTISDSMSQSSSAYYRAGWCCEFFKRPEIICDDFFL